MTSFVLIVTTKIFPSNFEIAPKQKLFFQPQIEICTHTNILKKKTFLCAKIFFCVHSEVLETLMWNFFRFCVLIFFKNDKNS